MRLRRRQRSSMRAWLVGASILGAAAAGTAALRVQVGSGDTVEALARRHYGDARRAPVIRAVNGVGDRAQPAQGTVIKLPGPLIHTVQAGETLASVAGQFLNGEGAPELLAEANGLAPGASLQAGQVITLFPEVEVRTSGRSAEELATTYLLDANLGARIRRYNGAADGGRLPPVVLIPLVGLELASALAATARAQDPPLDMRMPVTSTRAALTGFSHAQHVPMTIGGARVGCVVCHERTAPDAVSHRPPSSRNCLLCHREADDMPPAIRRGLDERLPLVMNHKRHAGDEAMACTTCHVAEPRHALGIETLGHEACATCHGPNRGAAPLVAGDPNALGCTGCHGTAEATDEMASRRRSLQAHLVRPEGRLGDVRFTHDTHRLWSPLGAAAAEVPCATCHADVPAAMTRAEIGRVPMQGCISCHGEAVAVGLAPPVGCQGCHLHHRPGLSPRDDVLVKKPLDHTPLFRRKHAEAARAEASLCAACHVGAASDGDRCDTCHLQTRPRDHTAGFRDKVHGRQSEVDPTRCQACHRAERCESCHRETPRSHFPLGAWVDRGLHGARARVELGACLTCHRFESACSRCHTAVTR